MSKLIKAIACVAFAAICGNLFAYNGGYENSSLTDITIGGVTYKGYGNNTLTARTESGTTIASNAYAQCSKLTSVNLANVTSIGNAAFAYSALTSVELPSTLKSLGYIAFGGCKNLSSITINSTAFMTSADEAKEPFRDCTALKTVTAKCAPPAWGFKKVFPNVTTVRCSAQNIAAWKAVGVSAVDMTAYTVRYVKNDGTSATIKHGLAYNVSTALKTCAALGWSRSGYEFVGWGSSASANCALYSDGQKVKNLAQAGETVFLYAIWAKAGTTYSIKYHRNDGSGATASFKYIRDVSFQLPSTQLGWSRSGYVLVGWTTAADSLTAKFANKQNVRNMAAAGKTTELHAVWAKSGTTYTLRYHKCDGTGAASSFVYIRDISGVLASSQLGWSRSGYTLIGWATDSSAQVATYRVGQQVRNVAAAGVTQDLYAVWAKTGTFYTLKYHRCDGSGLASSFMYIRGIASKLASTQLGWSRAGYTLIGWTSNPSSKTPDYYIGQEVRNVAAAGVTLDMYAIWAKTTDTYTIKYYKNDGSGDYCSYVYARNLSAKLSASQLNWTRSGYKIAGWSTSMGSSKIVYKDGDVVVNLAEAGGIMRLYVIWTPNAKASISSARQVNVASTVSVGVSTENVAIGCGYYMGDLASGEGSFELYLEDGCAYLRVFDEAGLEELSCVVERASSFIMLIAEDGRNYAFDGRKLFLVE